MSYAAVGADLLQEFLVSGRQFEDTCSRVSESLDLLASKDIIALPVLSKSEDIVDSSNSGLLGRLLLVVVRSLAMRPGRRGGTRPREGV